MATAAVVDSASGLVTNLIVADARLDPAPVGCELVDATNKSCGIGWYWNGSNFIGPASVYAAISSPNAAGVGVA